jgi:predicted transposase YbfD/YdcC
MAEICRQLQVWMLAQIPDGATGLDQLVCDGKTLRGSIVATDGGGGAFIAQVTLYSKALGAAIAQATFDTRENHERAVLQELLSTMDLEGVLIQADALHTQKPFSAPHGAGGRLPLDGESKPTDPAPPDQRTVPLLPQDPFHGKGFSARSRARDHLDTQGQTCS